MNPDYTYKAKCIKVIDGDTIYVDVDLGFFMTLRNAKLRLARINTPEIRGPERPQGLIAKKRMEELVLGKEILIETDKVGKYGRYIAEVLVPYEGGKCSVNDMMIQEGLAERYV